MVFIDIEMISSNSCAELNIISDSFKNHVFWMNIEDEKWKMKNEKKNKQHPQNHYTTLHYTYFQINLHKNIGQKWRISRTLIDIEWICTIMISKESYYECICKKWEYSFEMSVSKWKNEWKVQKDACFENRNTEELWTTNIVREDRKSCSTRGVELECWKNCVDIF